MTEHRRVPLADVRAAVERDRVPAGIIRVPGPISDAEFKDLLSRWESARCGSVIVTVTPPVDVPPTPATQRSWFRRQTLRGIR